jgi:hypothetical protein
MSSGQKRFSTHFYSACKGTSPEFGWVVLQKVCLYENYGGKSFLTHDKFEGYVHRELVTLFGPKAILPGRVPAECHFGNWLGRRDA